MQPDNSRREKMAAEGARIEYKYSSVTKTAHVFIELQATCEIKIAFFDNRLLALLLLTLLSDFATMKTPHNVALLWLASLTKEETSHFLPQQRDKLFRHLLPLFSATLLSPVIIKIKLFNL